MKKLLFVLLFATLMGLGIQATPVSMPEPSPQKSTTFRSTQKLRSDARFEMYVYSNHTIEMYDDEGRPAGSGTWQIKGGEFYIYANSGSLIEKCQCRISQGELKWVKFHGATYYKR